MQNRVWGYTDVQTHGGVITDNVCYDANGNLTLIANGSYYEGTKKGVNSSYHTVYGGKRTGAALVSKNTFGYGSFEVDMTIPAFNGICTSMWLYNNFENPLDPQVNHNYEIDIELHGTAVNDKGALRNAGNLSSIACTNWITELDSGHKTQYVDTGKPLNDGQFHTYRFDWHADRVDYYVDGEHLYTCSRFVPQNEMYFNIGCWFPNNWCGDPDFETDFMTVRSFRYTAFPGETAEKLHSEPKTGGNTLNPAIAVPERNYVANGGFAYDIGKNDAFTCSDAAYTCQAGSLTYNGTLTQDIDMDAGGLEYLLTVESSAPVTVTVHYLTFVGGESKLSEAAFNQGGGARPSRLNPPAGATRIRLIVSTGEATVTLNKLKLTLA